MKSTILHEIDRDDLKNLFREVLEENSKQSNIPINTGSKVAYLTRFEVVELLRISLPTLNNWTIEGKVHSQRIGNRVLYIADEIHQSVQPTRNLKYKRR